MIYPWKDINANTYTVSQYTHFIQEERSVTYKISFLTSREGNSCRFALSKDALSNPIWNHWTFLYFTLRCLIHFFEYVSLWISALKNASEIFHWECNPSCSSLRLLFRSACSNCVSINSPWHRAASQSTVCFCLIIHICVKYLIIVTSRYQEKQL